MRSFNIIFISIIFILMDGFDVFAENVNISGRIRDDDNNFLEFATIRIPGSNVGTNSNAKGEYSLTTAYKDTIDVVFSYLGFKTVTHRLISPSENIILNVKLYPSVSALKEVEITGFRDNINGMQSIDVNSFKSSPDVSGGSVESLISTSPGVHSSDELSTGYSVRGGSFDENSVYLNGVELFRPQLLRNGQQEGLSVINPSMVGNLLFSSGGFPARYDDKMSSVLDIIYRSPESFEGEIEVSAMGASLLLGQNFGKFSQLHGARYRKNNSLLSTLDTKGEYDPEFFDYQTYISFRPSDKFTIDFLGNISLNDFRFRPASRETSFGTMSNVKDFKVYFDGSEKDRFQVFIGNLSFNYIKNRSTSLSLSLSAFRTDEFVSYDISGEYWLDQAGNYDGTGGELGVGKYMEHARDRLKATVLSASLHGKTIIDNNNVTYGARYAAHNFRDRSKEWEWRDSAGYSLPVAPEGVNLLYNLHSRHDIRNNIYSFFAEDAVYVETANTYMTINGGLRGSYSDFNGEFLISPRVNIKISLSSNRKLSLRAAVGLYYQSPFYKEYRQSVADELGNVSVILNDKIKSPRSLQFILGTDYVFDAMGRPFKLSGEAYYKKLDNLISYEYDNLKVSYSGVNDSRGYAMGVDFKLFGQFVPGSDSWISFSLMKTSQTLDGIKVPLPNDQRYAMSLYFTDYFPKFPKLKFSLKGILSDGLTVTAPHVRRSQGYFRMPPYKRVDIGFSYDIIGENDPLSRGFLRYFKRITLGLDLFNLFDIANVSSYYWVTDVNGLQYAVPNYLTRRQVNVSLSLKF